MNQAQRALKSGTKKVIGQPKRSIMYMSQRKELQCGYLSADKRSCTAINDVEGQATRSQSCSAKAKDLCCYLCEKREICEISCSLQDQAAQQEGRNNLQMSLVTSPDSTEKAFACPICGAYYQKPIEAGTAQVRCGYCGANVLLPTRLGGPVQLCPNHSETYATGLCNDCERSFCDRCLYACNVEGGRLYLCAGCYQNRMSSAYLGFFIIAIIFAALMMMALIALRNPGNTSDPSSAFVGFILAGATLLIIVLWAIRWSKRRKPQSVHDLRAAQL